MSQKDLINLSKLKISVRIKNQIGQKYEKKWEKIFIKYKMNRILVFQLYNKDQRNNRKKYNPK